MSSVVRSRNDIRDCPVPIYARFNHVACISQRSCGVCPVELSGVCAGSLYDFRGQDLDFRSLTVFLNSTPGVNQGIPRTLGQWGVPCHTQSVRFGVVRRRSGLGAYSADVGR